MRKYFAYLFLMISFSSKAQLEGFTDFEAFKINLNFTQSSWEAAGFTVPFVNGFDQNRAMIDGNTAVSGTKSLRMFFPKGKFGTDASGGQAPLVVTPRDEYYMSYQVKFSDNFSWGTKSEGGKLPGLAGGDRCSGCKTCTGSNGFSSRLMWRQDGKAIIYLYHMNKAGSCGDNYDILVDGKTFYFQKGVWAKITQRVKVNTGSNKNGEVEMWINDKPAQLKLLNGIIVDKLTGIQFVSNGGKVDALYFSTFHGGNDINWVPTTDCYAWFDDVIISTRQSDVVNTTASLEDDYLNSKDLTIAPNPIKSGQKLTLPNFTSSNEIVWMNSYGQELIRTESIDQNTTFVPQLPLGLYFVKYQVQGGYMISKIIID